MRAVLAYLVKGWSLAPIVSIASGLPLKVVTATTSIDTTSAGGGQLRGRWRSIIRSQWTGCRLYLSAGFRPFGLEPQALTVADRYIDEEHMVLEI